METLDFSKPVKLKNPEAGEEKLIFRVTNYNEVTNRCYIELIDQDTSNLTILPQELVSINDIENTL